MLSAFRQIHKLPNPTEWGIQNFCGSVFDDLDENPQIEAQVTEIRHYKEKVLSIVHSLVVSSLYNKISIGWP